MNGHDVKPIWGGPVRRADDTLEQRVRPPHDGGMEARVAALESECRYIRRDLDEVRTDVRAIKDKVSAIDVTLAGMSSKLDNFPTKLQLSLWGGGVLLTALVAAAALIAVLLRLTGHPDAAAAVDAIRGK